MLPATPFLLLRKPPIIAAGGGAPTWTGTAAVVNDAASGTTNTSSGVAIGTASPTREVVVGAGVYYGGLGTIISIAAGAVTLTQRAVLNGAVSTIALYSGNVPTGTTANIVVTTSAGMVLCDIGVGVLDSLSSSTPTSTATGLYENSQLSPYPTTGNVTVASGGFGIAVGWKGATSPITWSNMTGDNHAEGGTSAIQIAHISSAGAIAPTVTAADFITVGVAAAAWS